MKEFKISSEYTCDSWFWFDKEEFSGEWKIGQCRYRIEKEVGRGSDGKLYLMVWINHDKYDKDKFSQVFYEIDNEEFLTFLDRAVEQGEVDPDEREEMIEKATAPFIAPWDIHKDVVVYKDERYTLGQENDRPYLMADGKKYILSCHPYEPCLYITDERGNMTAVHNAFDPFAVLELFYSGVTVTSITGMEYDAKDFCKMVEYASEMVDIQIDYAEKVFKGRAKKKDPEPGKEKKQNKQYDGKSQMRPESGKIIENDPFYDLIAGYPDSVIDYCLVINEQLSTGRNAHWFALVWASRKLFLDDDGEVIWHFDAGKAEARQIDAGELFAPAEKGGRLNYRKAFLDPPYKSNYTDADFDKINSALFPNGTDGLEVFEWTTDWSEYFDEGHEWWGTLCLTVYDKALDRFVVIMASATD
ncbi:MAG: hypothetical protein IJS94_00100 [Clostridia bacterium]|nr:hypothetical protein [Clostridia bacterium]